MLALCQRVLHLFLAQQVLEYTPGSTSVHVFELWFVRQRTLHRLALELALTFSFLLSAKEVLVEATLQLLDFLSFVEKLELVLLAELKSNLEFDLLFQVQTCQLACN
jgi:hypothetical protein